MLFVRGQILPTDGIAVAIVGTRHATQYGIAQADRLAAGLARCGYCVVSGLARGIDAAAHRGAMKAQGRTLAVLGSGVLNVYPPEHESLANEVIARGALISENPPHSPPLSGVSLASVNAQSSNPGNVFEIGQIVFDNTTQDGTTCISAASSGGQTSNGGCRPIFRVFNAVPGTTASGRLTLRNAGTVPIQRLVVWAPQACASASAPNLIHGSGDLCGRVWLSLHDDSHDQCYFPANQAGPCPLAASGTMASFAGSYGPGHELALSPEGLAGGLTYTLRVELDPAAGNEDMGRAASMDFSWGISS